MDRRTFVRAGLVAAAGPVIGRGAIAPRTSAAQSATDGTDRAPYTDWIPDTSHVGTDRGVHFTHLDWARQDALQRAMAGDGSGVGASWARVVGDSPILSMPLAGAETTPTALTVISRYPFSDDLTAAADRERPVGGIRIDTTTWTGELFVFHGAFDPAIVADRYTTNFAVAAERGNFTVYVGTTSNTADLSYAVSRDTLVVGLESATTSDDTATVVTDPIDRSVEGRGRVIDTEAGQWLFDAAGAGHLGVGGWHLDDPLIALGAGIGGSDESGESIEVDRLSGWEGGDGRASAPRRAVVPSADEGADVAAAESVANTITVSVTDGDVDALEARFAGIYPDGVSPARRDVRDELIGVRGLPHEIEIDGDRVFATARLETWSGTKA